MKSIKVPNFTKDDIGSELISILTKGIYVHPLDSIREYIQNSIDSNPSKIDIKINPHSIVIVDDGDGMNMKQLSDAKKLGISTKDPRVNVGFRGIGIFSAFPYCDQLILLTQKKKGGSLFLKIDFENMKTKLDEIQQSRLTESTKHLSLVDLLSDSIEIGNHASDAVSTSKGTKVILSGLDLEMHKYMKDRNRFNEYLQNTVPLKFDPTFSFESSITEYNKDFSGKVDIFIDDVPQNRPYTNKIFLTEQGLGPLFYYESDNNVKLNVYAWAVFNDSKLPFKDMNIRGLLVKYKGFSIGNRDYLRKFSVNHSKYIRATGEILIEPHDDLRPLAGRDDFEPSPTSVELNKILDKLVRTICEDSSKVHNHYVSSERLEDSKNELASIHEQISEYPKTDDLLMYKNRIENAKNKLKSWRDYKNALDGRFDIETQPHSVYYVNIEKKLKELIKVLSKRIKDRIQKRKKYSTRDKEISSKKIDDIVKQADKEIEKAKEAITSDEIIDSILSIMLQNDYCAHGKNDELIEVFKLIDSILEERLTQSELESVYSDIQIIILGGE